MPAVKSIRSLVRFVKLPPSIANSCPVCYLKQDTGSIGSDFSLFFESTFHNFTRQSSETETSNVYVEVVLAAKIPLTESKWALIFVRDDMLTLLRPLMRV